MPVLKTAVSRAARLPSLAPNISATGTPAPAAAPRYQTSESGMATAIGSTQRHAASRAMRAFRAASGSHDAVQMANRPASPTATKVRATRAGQ